MKLNRHTNRVIQALLLGICIISGVALITRIFQPAELTSEGIAVQDSSLTTGQLEAAIVQEASPITAYAEMIARPLFSETRRPPEPEIVVAPVRERRQLKPEPEETFSLSGTIVTGGQRLALIIRAQGNNIERFREGDEVGGWIVAEINPTHVLLTRGAEEQRLELQVMSAPARRQNRTPAEPTDSAVEVELVNIEAANESESEAEEEGFESELLE